MAFSIGIHKSFQVFNQHACTFSKKRNDIFRVRLIQKFKRHTSLIHTPFLIQFPTKYYLELIHHSRTNVVLIFSLKNSSIRFINTHPNNKHNSRIANNSLKPVIKRKTRVLHSSQQKWSQSQTWPTPHQITKVPTSNYYNS